MNLRSSSSSNSNQSHPINDDVAVLVQPPSSSASKDPRENALQALLDLSRVNHKTQIMLEPTLKDAHIYCKMHRLSGQVTGPLIEHYLIATTPGWTKHKSSLGIGDAGVVDPATGTVQNIEIKASLGGERTHREFNYVQIRLHHPIHIYVLTAYHVDSSNLDALGELYVFHVTHDQMKDLLARHGSYAHGTVTKHGAITRTDLDDETTNTKEYALRPKYGDACWQALLVHRIG